jgi:hypothetical protein
MSIDNVFGDAPVTVSLTDGCRVGARGAFPSLRIVQNVWFLEFGAEYALKVVPDSSVGPLAAGHWTSVPETLAKVDGHRDAGPLLKRYRFQSPFHAAIHEIVDGSQTVPDYCSIHTHWDVAELNVIVPRRSKVLRYSAYVRGSWRSVVGPAVLWFPAGEPHCATAVEGSGYFVVFRLVRSPAPAT